MSTPWLTERHGYDPTWIFLLYLYYVVVELTFLQMTLVFPRFGIALVVLPGFSEVKNPFRRMGAYVIHTPSKILQQTFYIIHQNMDFV